MSHDVLLILSMHRSGTSALTRVLSLLGAELPKSMYGKTTGNQRGHWESDSLVVANEAFLKKMKSSWDDWRPLAIDKLSKKRRAAIISSFGAEFTDAFDLAKPLLVMKDPRVCRFADMYIEALGDLPSRVHPVITVRNPLEVASSLESRDGLPRSEALLLWLSYMLNAEIASRGLQRAIITYHAFLDNPVKCAQKIVKALDCPFSYSPKDVRVQIKNYVSERLKHHSHTTEDVLLDPATRGWISDAYQAFLVLSETPDSKIALETLDGIRGELAAAAGPIHKFMEVEKKSHLTKVDEIKSAHGREREEAQTAYERGMQALEESTKALLEARESELKALLDERDRSTTQMLSERDKDMTRLQSEFQASMANIESKLHQSETDKFAFEAKFNETNLHFAALTQDRDNLAREKSELLESVDKLASENIALKNSRDSLAEANPLLTQSRDSLAAANPKLQNSKTKLSQDNALLKESQAKLAEDNARLQESQRKLTEDNAHLKVAESKLAQDVAALRQSENDMTSQNRALSEGLQAYKDHVEGLEEANIGLNAKVSELNEEYKKSAAQSSTLLELNKSLTKNVELLAGDKAALEEQVRNTKKSADEARAKQQDLLSRAEAELAAARKDSIAEKRSRVQEIEFMKNEFGTMRAELESEIEARGVRNEETEARLAHLHEESDARLAQLHDDVAQRDHSISTLTRQHSHLQEQLDAVLSSTSWKITGGIRAVLNALRGRNPAAIAEADRPPRLTYDKDGA